uniref:ATP synthase F0 subunit 8 n=1 Tax=Trachinocephalus myops TaxID=172131 RepID=UPI0028D8428C|nr:ATP synthase F0 subunit 8 [Trachinocephalus myops]WMY89997.1 ATP synthase F0 subunit 8 [Trachinocephalus myops]
MPQLNPSPWFSIFIFSWLVFLTFLPTKVIKHTFPHDPLPQPAGLMDPQPWTWPWT